MYLVLKRVDVPPGSRGEVDLLLHSFLTQTPSDSVLVPEKNVSKYRKRFELFSIVLVLTCLKSDVRVRIIPIIPH